MREKNNSERDWIIFSVLSVIVPVIFAFILSSIINKKIVELSSIIESVILVVFSIACNLLSICRNVYKQKEDKFTQLCYAFSLCILFLSWTVYIYSLVRDIIYLKTLCVFSLFIVIICSLLGIKLGKLSDKNENETICMMHKNCDFIMKKSMNKKTYDSLSPHTIKDYDLLCNPNEFDRIKKVIKNIEHKGN